MKYRKRITLWAAIIALGAMVAVYIVERSRAYAISDIISDDVSADTLPAAAGPVAVDSLAIDSLSVDSAAVKASAVDTAAVDSLKKAVKGGGMTD